MIDMNYNTIKFLFNCSKFLLLFYNNNSFINFFYLCLHKYINNGIFIIIKLDK
jgi:hypothetical protein